MKITKNNLQIAIDGPVAAGKGTVSKLLAEKLSLLYVDTGAMYRALSLFVVENNADLKNEAAICELLKKHQPQVSLAKPTGDKKDGRLVSVFLNSRDVSWAIRTEQISQATSIITSYKYVREYSLPQQQQLAQSNSVVMEGRDITTRVLPNADLKIYMDANLGIRAQRRYVQMLKRGEIAPLPKVKQEIQQRDHRDSHRQNDPLTKTADSWYLNTSKLNIEGVVEVICEKLKQLGYVV